ncbi:MAG: leucine-rich repeat domain-containing protein [Oscillospiraceae bacterium]|nr:leucine-rich repeat domain-containing protein [Oscillospiraceae bacterium]
MLRHARFILLTLAAFLMIGTITACIGSYEIIAPPPTAPATTTPATAADMTTTAMATTETAASATATTASPTTTEAAASVDAAASVETAASVDAADPATTTRSAAVPLRRPEFRYSIYYGKVTITEYIGSGGNVVIPDTILGMSVTGIAEYAFDGCDNLISLNIHKDIGYIGRRAFYNCPNLASIDVSEENPDFTSIDGALFSKDMHYLIYYPAGNPRTRYATPEGVEVIVDGAFSHCSNLTDLTLSNDVTKVEEWAFVQASSLKSLTIQGNVSFIEYRAFIGASSLSNISVSADNQYYCSVDGVLFDKEKTKLVQYPPASDRTSYAIPEGIIEIDGYAFGMCKNLSEVTLPEGLEIVGYASFEGCGKLASIKLPDSLKLISMWAFKHCPFDEITIPPNVTIIGGHSFEINNLLVATILAPDVEIYDSAFTNPPLEIRGYIGSTAEDYARQYGFKFVGL